MITYNEQLARETERGYLMPEIVNQRVRTMARLQLQAGERVLDLGCGMGLLTHDLALAVGEPGRVTAIDISQPMIQLAQNRCEHLPQVELRVGSVEQLPDSDSSYDAITCTQLLLYIPDVAQVLGEMYRVLRPGGRVAIIETDWRGVLFNTMDEDFTRQLFEQWEASIPSPFLPGRLRQLLHQTGLHNIRVEAIPIVNTSYHPDNYSAGMATYMLRTAVKNGTVSPEQADAFLADLQARSKTNDYFFCVNRFLFTAVK